MSPSPTVEAAPDGLCRTRGGEVDLAFRQHGSGPAVVLLHGTSASHAVWEPVAQALSTRAMVCCLDQRGHGRSDKPAHGYDAEDFAGDVLVVLDALGIERAIVGGHSLGARNAWVAGARYPDRVAGVLAVDYTPFVSAAVLDDLARRVAGGDRSFSSLGEVEDYLHSRYSLLPGDAVRRRARWGYRGSTPTPTPTPSEGSGKEWRPLADARAMQQLIAGLREPHLQEFLAVDVPMTHLRGGLSRIVDDDAWDRAVAARPHDRWVLDPGVDHYLPEEHPDLVVEELVALLDAGR